MSGSSSTSHSKKRAITSGYGPTSVMHKSAFSMGHHSPMQVMFKGGEGGHMRLNSDSIGLTQVRKKVSPRPTGT